MPVSVEVTVTPLRTLGTTGSWPIIETRVEIRTMGHFISFVTNTPELMNGVTRFFEKLPNHRPNRKRLRKASMQQEEKSAEALGGRRVSGSGARPGHKGDGRVPGRFRIENKFTTAASIRVKLSELRKIRAECEGLEVPVFDVQFKEKVTLRTIDNWVLVPRDHWETLANAQVAND